MSNPEDTVRSALTQLGTLSGAVRIMRRSGRGINLALVAVLTELTGQPPLAIHAYHSDTVAPTGNWDHGTAQELTRARVIILDSPSMGSSPHVERAIAQLIEKRLVTARVKNVGNKPQEFTLRPDVLIVLSEVDGSTYPHGILAAIPKVTTLTTVE